MACIGRMLLLTGGLGGIERSPDEDAGGLQSIMGSSSRHR